MSSINSETDGVVSPLSEAIRKAPDIEARPDLILRLVDLLFLLADETETRPS